MKKGLLLIMLVGTNQLFAQTGKCLKGNCNTGIGKMLYKDSSVYEGRFVQGRKEGKGVFKSTGDDVIYYTGNWKNDDYDGDGKLHKQHFYEKHVIADDTYEGTFKNGKLNGQGVHVTYLSTHLRTDSNLIWKGNFVNNVINGKGSLRVKPNVTFYSDSFTDDFHFTDGKEVREKTNETHTGSFAGGTFTISDKNGSPPQTTTGSGFKTLNFHKANSTIIRQNVFQSELVSTLSSAKTGTITINTKEGIITISTSGESDKVYKIISVGAEVKDKWDDKTITITCTDDGGAACTATIKKQYAYTTSNEMLFYTTYANGTGKGYTCDFLSNVYEN